MYRKYIKRLLDFFISLVALILLSPVLLILTVVGAVAMHGNPFFTQQRPGKNEKIFRLIKFRTMSNKRDSEGNLLPDEVRVNKYGRLLRCTSLDELPELLNILVGDMSLVGPRPLLVEYLPYYTEREHHRHDMRPGLTGLAQINGRNAISSWEERFEYDLKYIDECSLKNDVSIIMKTVSKVIKHSDIQLGSEIKVGRLDDARKEKVCTFQSENSKEEISPRR